MAVAGDVMYFHSGGRVVIADISNPADPVELGSLDFGNMVQFINVRGNYLYVDGDPYNVCFRIYDISDPATPMEVYASCAIYWSVTGLTWYGDVAYTVMGQGGDVRSWDMSDPENPVMQSYVYGRGDAVAVSGDYLFVVTDRAMLRVYDLVPDPYDPPMVAEVPLPEGDEGGPIVIQGDYAYIAAHGSNANVAVVNISDPLAPVAVGTIPATSDARGIALTNGILHVAPEYSYVVKLFDVVSNPATPTQVGALATDAYVTGVSAAGAMAYVYDEGEGVILVDTSSPANPIRLGNVHCPEWLTKEDLAGDLLYVADRWNGFTILDVSDPLHIPMHPVGVYH